MRYRLLGPLEVEDADGAPVDVRRGRPRSFLHLLLLHQRVVVPAEVAVERLWGDDRPENAANAVHQLVSYLRRALGSARGDLVTSPVGYRLDVGDDDVDATRFSHLMARAAAELSGDPLGGRRTTSAAAAERALRAAEEAARLWRGEPMPESQDHAWATADITRLKETYLAVQEARLEAMLRLGRHREVVLEAQSLASAYPYRELFHGLTALALYRSDRATEALEGLRAVRELLARELGLDPGAALRELEQRILTQDPVLGWEPPPDLVTLAARDGGEEAEQVGGAAGTSAPSAPGATVPASPAPPVRLPPPGPALVGRAADLESLVQAVQPAAVVTLTGVPGVGKTALALSAAHELAQAGRTVWWVDVHQAGTAGLVGPTVAAQLGLEAPPGGDWRAQVSGVLGDARGVLVLDGCEEVLPAVLDLVGLVREAAPELGVLLVSRRSAAAGQGRQLRLDPLPVESLAADAAAVQLFTDRATRARADFRLTEENLADVSDVVRAVDGVPLAIEVAAGNVDVMSVAAIAAELGEEAPGAAPGILDPLDRAVDASIRLLEPAERDAFVTWAVFRGAFTVEDAAEVAELPVPVARSVLSSLVRQSLVSHGGGEEYRLLRPVHARAARLLQGRPEVEAVRERHCARTVDVVVSAAEQLDDSPTALPRLGRYRADAQAALDWSLTAEDLEAAGAIAVSYRWHWAVSGHLEEGLAWLRRCESAMDAAVRRGQAVDPAAHAAVLRSIGLLVNPLGDVAEGRRVSLRAIELFEQAGDDVGVVDSLVVLGISEWALGDCAAAAATHDEASRRAEQLGQGRRRLIADVLRARTAVDAREPDALEAVERAIELASDQGERQFLAIATAQLARHHLQEGDLGRAGLAAERSLAEATALGYPEGRMSALNLLGRVAVRSGDLETARRQLLQALVEARDTHHVGAACETLESLALAALAEGSPERAYLLLTASSRERARRGTARPPGDAAAVEEGEAACRAVLGEATELIQARVKLRRFEDIVTETLSG